jgi:hypothetical protein
VNLVPPPSIESNSVSDDVALFATAFATGLSSNMAMRIGSFVLVCLCLFLCMFVLKALLTSVEKSLRKKKNEERELVWVKMEESRVVRKGERGEGKRRRGRTSKEGRRGN